MFTNHTHRLLFLLAFSWTTGPLPAQPSSLETALFDLPDLSFRRIETPEGFSAAWELTVRQPLDHDHPEKGHFYQKAYLSHRGPDRPMVLCTEGYQRPRNRVYELAQLLDANQLVIEHRFFGESVPTLPDYEDLNLRQVTADLHHIRELFRALYPAPWLSTGISKGGQTTLFYRFHYPDDVAVSVPFVAPLNLSLEDPRIYDFLDTVGSDACRRDILAFQRKLLQERAALLPRLQWYARGAGLTFDYLGFGPAFEYAVLEYPFSFWQWGHDCGTIPSPDAPPDSLLNHLVHVSGIDFFADESMRMYAPHYYQAGTEMGYYGYRTAPFEGLLEHLPTDVNPSAVFMPEKAAPTFDGRLVRQLQDWLDKEGNHIIYIYGAADTWSATAVRPSGHTDAAFFFLPGADHAKARIAHMSRQDRTALIGLLEAWLDLDIAE